MIITGTIIAVVAIAVNVRDYLENAKTAKIENSPILKR